ncbi:MAG: 3-oxoacyl-ACP reductase FabG [Cyanobacteria bacterium J06558_2]
MKDRNVLLTGGTGGLGQGVLPSVIEQGASVIVPYRQEESADSLRQKLSAEHLKQVKFVKADLTVESEVIEIFSGLDKVDVLIHLVGGFDMGKIHQYSVDDWQKTFSLNLLTTFITCKHCLKLMQKHNYGRIITVGSRGAVDPAPQLGAYSAAKAGVVALTKAIAEENQDYNITANAVLPSVIDTPANRQDMGEENADQWVKPASLARLICFLASEDAGDISGAAIPIYGDA